jgi:hypothetical protein
MSIMFPNSGSSNVYSLHYNHTFLCGFLGYEMMQPGSILEEYMSIFSIFKAEYPIQKFALQ